MGVTCRLRPGLRVWVAASIALALGLGALASAAAAVAAPRIVYHSASSPAGLWVMGIDGSSPKPFLAGGNAADFSGDGTKVVYQVGGDPACNVNFGFGQIVVANADGSSPVTIGGAGGCNARISPDGTRVAYIAPFANGDQIPVMVASVSDPTHPHQILPFTNCIPFVQTTYPNYPNKQSVCVSSGNLDWVDNANIVVSGYQNGLWVIPAAGGNPHPILSGTDQSSDWYGGLAVSPDSGTIAGYPLSQSAAAFVLATVPAGGGSLKILYTQNGNNAATFDYPEWSPDGQTLVVRHVAGSGGQFTDRVAVIAAAGGTPKDLNPADASASFPTFAPPAGNHNLKGLVTDGAGAPSPNVTVDITGPKTTSATTGADGRFSIDLPEGTYAITPHVAGTVFPVQSADCTIQGDGCKVVLDRDRLIGFSGCVVPDPGGGKLPPSTPDPIPGAVIKPPLEAVGCWKPQNGGAGAEPTIYTTKQPVRLDGIDVKPAPGTTLTLDTSALTVTANGFAQLLVGGFPITPEIPVSLTYHGGAAAAPVSVDDLAAGATPFGFTLFGVPLQTSGGPASFLPVQETTGQTVFNGGFQLPLNTRAVWDLNGGKFVDQFGGDVPSAGVSGSITTTDRDGVQGQLCLSINDWEPFKFAGSFGKILGAQLCFNPTQRLWTGTGMFELPAGLARLAGEINVQFTSQDVPSARTGALQGYQLQSFQVQFDHLNTHTFTLPGFDPRVRSSGLPIGGGFFLQSLGGGFKNDLATGTISSIDGTAGITFGPEIDLNKLPLTLVRLDGELVLSPPKTAADFWTYGLTGAATIGRLTPFEMQFANLTVKYVAKPNFGEGDVRGHAGADLPVVGGLSIDLAGHQDATSGLLLDGIQRARVFGVAGTNELLLDNTILAYCATAGDYSSGFDFDFATRTISVGCNLGQLHRPRAAASAARASRSLTLHLRHGLAGSMLAIRGRGAPPKVLLRGPATRINAVPHRHPTSRRGYTVYSDARTDTTFISLLRPRGGAWKISTLRGSSKLVDVREADPLPRPTITGRLKRKGCSAVLHYNVRGRGERILLYAQEGAHRIQLGFARKRKGQIAITIPGTRGRGRIVAVFLRAGHPTGEQLLTTFSLKQPTAHRCSSA